VSRATLAAGATATFLLTVTVNANASGTITNTATVTSTTPDPIPGNNTASVSNTVASADVQAVKTGPATTTPGATIDYTITFTNNGPDDALAVQLSDTLPANTTFVSFNQTS